jgi:hypothetical protein
MLEFIFLILLINHSLYFMEFFRRAAIVSRSIHKQIHKRINIHKKIYQKEYTIVKQERMTKGFNVLKCKINKSESTSKE